MPRLRSPVLAALVVAAAVPAQLAPAAVAATPADARPETASTIAAPDGGAPARVLWRESFDSLADALLPRVEDPGIAPGEIGFTHDGPAGWSVEHDASMAEIGVEEWRGWSFTTRDFWTDAEDQRRYRFGRSLGVVAVADSDEFHDLDPGVHTYDTTMTSAPVDVGGEKRLELAFDSHYRSWTDQVATVTVELDGSGDELELLRLDETSVKVDDDLGALNANEVVGFDVPAGTSTAVFRWRLQADANSWYWAVDNVAVRRPLRAAGSAMTSAWVVSDIQGHPADLARGLQELHAVRPDAAGLVMVGDIVNSGSEAEWADIDEVMAEQEAITPPKRVAVIGNHESYAGEPWEVLRDRFLAFAGRERTWGQTKIRGPGGVVPVLVLGQEFDRDERGEVGMTNRQVRWFDRRLDHWTERGKQVLVATHFPLGDTVSASWIPWYHDHHERNDELLAILGEHPNAIVFTGHTHYSPEHGDWAVQRRVEGGHPDGFWAVNTSAMHVGWEAQGESTSSITEVTTGDVNDGLVVDVLRDRVVVEVRHLGLAGSDPGSEVVRTLTIPNPLRGAQG